MIEGRSHLLQHRIDLLQVDDHPGLRIHLAFEHRLEHEVVSVARDRVARAVDTAILLVGPVRIEVAVSAAE